MELVEKFRLLRFLDEHKIHMLFFSILCLVLLPPYLSEHPKVMSTYMNIIFLPIVAACFLIIRKIHWSRYLSIGAFIFIAFNTFFDNVILDTIAQVGLTFVILHASSLVLREAISLRGSKGDLILMSLTGYLIIGLLGGFLAEGLHNVFPDSFSNSAGIDLGLYNFMYYSFVTMTTLGYGDIIPVTDKAQSLALLLVLSGQLYLSVIIALNIGKFMQQRNK